MKFLDWKKRPILLNPIDTLSGIDAITNENLEALEQNNEEYLPLVEPESQEDEDSELDVDCEVNQSELADLLDGDDGPSHAPGNNNPDDEANVPDNDDERSHNDDADQCVDENDDDLDGDPRV